MSSSVRDSRRSSRLRDSSGEMTEKNGFSVVAATSVTHRFSTPGSSASCWALLNRCTSSTNSTVSRPVATSSWRAWSMAARTSLTPADTAETSTNRRSVCWLTIEAIVVFPVPGGPHSSSDIDWSPSISRRSGAPAARSCSWPTSSSRVRGRIRTASGADACVLAARAPPPPGGRPATVPGASNESVSHTLTVRRRSDRRSGASADTSSSLRRRTSGRRSRGPGLERRSAWRPGPGCPGRRPRAAGPW